MKTFLVFVYGSLLRGLHNYHFLLDTLEVKFIRRDFIRAKLYTAHWGWPFMVFSQSSKDRLMGEVYEVPHNVFKNMDGLEGYHPGRKDCLFIRKQAHTKSGLTVYVYEGGPGLRNRCCHEIKNSPAGFVNWRAVMRTITIWANREEDSEGRPFGNCIGYQNRELAVRKFVKEGHAIEHPRAEMSWYEIKREERRANFEGIVLKPKTKSDFSGMIKMKKTPGCDLKNAMVDQLSGNTPHPF